MEMEVEVMIVELDGGVEAQNAYLDISPRRHHCNSLRTIHKRPLAYRNPVCLTYLLRIRIDTSQMAVS